MSILQFIWVGDLDETKTQRLQNPQALSYNKGHPKKMIVRQDKKETRIGRKNSKIPPDYALESAVSNRMISRNHVTIERLSKGNYMLYDHSLNGTYVNFVRVIGGTILKHEDVVCFGHINGANIKPGESVTPFATDLKYRVEIIDKIIAGDKSGSGGSMITRKTDNNNYSQSESDQYDEAASSELNRKTKSNKHKSLINNEKSKKIKLIKQESDDSDRSSDSSDASNNNNNNNNSNSNNNNTNINANNYNRKPKKPADLSSLSSSDDDRLKSNSKNSKDRQFSSKKPPPIGAGIDSNSKTSSKHSSSLNDARYHELSYESKKLSKSIDDDGGSNNRRLYSSTGGGGGGGGMKDRKMHLNQKSHSKPKYSDNSNNNNNTSNNSNNNNSSNNNNTNKSMKRNINNLNSNNYDYEECSAHPCSRPDGENLIDWIMCDKCAQWFHQSCVGLDEAIEDDENYYCPYCVR